MRATAQPRVLGWQQSLQFKVAALFTGLALLLGAAAYLAGTALVREELLGDNLRYERESGLRLADRLEAIASQAQQLANTLSALAVQPGSDARGDLAAMAPGLIERSPANPLLVGVGVWPLPRTLDPARERASLFWQRDPAGALALREDYNDPRAIAYYQESWFTPARYAQIDRCYWTAAYREPLTRQEVVTCVLPLRDSRGFVGVVTVSLSTIRLNESFARITAGEAGYSLLVGPGNRLLGISDEAARRLGPEPPRNLAELAQQRPGLSPLALAVHQQHEAFVSAAVQSPLYDAATVSALKEATRDLSRPEAEAALAAIWNGMARRDGQAEPSRQLRLEDDALLGEPANVALFELPQTSWHLIRVTSANEGFSGVRYVFTQTLVVVGGGVLLTLLLVFVGLNYLVIRPLRRMTDELTHAESVEDALHLQFDESARNEIGVLAHWHNERVRQLREMMERTIATNSQLVVESDERRTAQEALAKAQERATLALQAVADGVVTTNERGIVEEMNPVAEQLTGVAVRAARGRAFSDIFKARVGGGGSSAPGSLLPNLAEVAIQRATRLEYEGGVFLQREGQPESELYVSVTPIRTRLNRVIGAIVVFRPCASGATERGPERRTIDAVTGLPNRLACDRSMRALLEGQRVNPRPHSLLLLDVDHLKRINDVSGQQAGDEVLTRIGESLVARVGNAGEVFRLGADHFAVVLENFEVERAMVFAEALRELLANTRIYWESKPLNVTVSIGVVSFDPEADNPVELLRRAEDACAAAKRAGRNSVTLYEMSLDRAERAVDDAIWVKRIRTGLEQNLFHLTTQWVMPAQVHQPEGQVFELLLALEDEEGFWASPTAFMPAAERHHLIPDMDRWVIRHTLDHLARYPDTLGRLAFCTINLSATTLSDGELLDYLAQQFQRHEEVPPRKLCFELREESLSEFPNQAHTFCDAMRSLGVRVAVDHFMGRSISDVALIRKLQVDFIKIDALQFRNVMSDPVEQMMAESVIRLARTLRKRVVVSGIGDASSLDAWRRLGADYFQGFTVAKPSPVVFYAPGG